MVMMVMMPYRSRIPQGSGKQSSAGKIGPCGKKPVSSIRFVVVVVVTTLFVGGHSDFFFKTIFLKRGFLVGLVWTNQ